MAMRVSCLKRLAPQQPVLPSLEDALEARRIDGGEHALKGAFLGMFVAPVAAPVAAQRAQLGLGEFGGKGGKVALAAHHSAERGQHHDGQQAGQGIVTPFARTPLGHGAAELPQVAHFRHRGGAARDDFVFHGLKPGRQPPGAQDLARRRLEQTHPELLGTLVLGVIILPAAPETPGVPE